jgi:hypothetical protein
MTMQCQKMIYDLSNLSYFVAVQAFLRENASPLSNDIIPFKLLLTLLLYHLDYFNLCSEVTFIDETLGYSLCVDEIE